MHLYLPACAISICKNSITFKLETRLRISNQRELHWETPQISISFWKDLTSWDRIVSNWRSGCWWGQTRRSTALQYSKRSAAIVTQLRRKQISNRARMIRPKLALMYELSATREKPSRKPRDRYTWYKLSLKHLKKSPYTRPAWTCAKTTYRQHTKAHRLSSERGRTWMRMLIFPYLSSGPPLTSKGQ